MTVQFNQIPGNLRVPFAYFEVNAAASPFETNAKLLLVGQITTAGTAAPGAAILVTQGEDGLFGPGSMLALMYKVARLNAPFQEIWALPLLDAAGSSAAVGSITLAGTSPRPVPLTTAGSLVYYIGDVRVVCPVTTTMSAAAIAAALVVAINTCPTMAVVAAVDGTVTTKVNLTALNKGTLGNSIGIYTSLFSDDDPLADQIGTIITMSGGAGDPSATLTAAVAGLGDEPFDWIAYPYADSGSIAIMTSFLLGRWGPMSQAYGYFITTAKTTAGGAVSAMDAQDSPYGSYVPVQNVPAPTFLWTAAIAAVAAVHLQDAPELSRPVQTLAVQGLRGPKALADRWSVVQRQTFYFDGVSGWTVARDGTIMLDRLVTMYQTNVYGQPDQAFLDINTMAQLMYGLRYLQQLITDTYPRSALADSNPFNLQGVVTVADIFNTLVHGYVGLVQLGVFENSAVFQQMLIVERNTQDPNRVDCFLPLDAVNQLRVFAANATSYLEFPAAS